MITYFFQWMIFLFQALQCMFQALRYMFQALGYMFQSLKQKFDRAKEDGRTDSRRKTITILVFLKKNNYLCAQKGAKQLTLGRLQASLHLLSLNRCIAPRKAKDQKE